MHCHPAGAATIEVEIVGKSIRAAWAGEGWLSQIRGVLKDLRARPDIIVARRMSPGARVALAAKGVGWIDELGAAEISIGTIVVSRSGRRDSVRERSTRWTGSVVAVAEAIICTNEAWTVAKVRKVTGLSTGSCTNALRILTDLGLLVTATRRGPTSDRTVADKGKLLDAYAEAAISLAPSSACSVGVIWPDPVKGLGAVAGKWDKAGIEWVATGAVAAALLAPVLTNVATTDVYVNASSLAELDAITSKMGLQVIEGGRLTLKPFPSVTTSRLAKTIDGIKVAPWPRVYVDLRQIGVRGEEAAEHLREVMLG